MNYLNIKLTLALMLFLICLGACKPQEVKLTDVSPTRSQNVQPEQQTDISEEQLLALISQSECQPLTEMSHKKRKAFVEQFQEETGNACLSEIGFTDEGDPIYSYLLIKDHAARLIIDGREDKFWGSSPKVREMSIADLSYGYWDLAESQFVISDDADPHRDGIITGIISFRLENVQVYRSFNWLGP